MSQSSQMINKRNTAVVKTTSSQHQSSPPQQRQHKNQLRYSVDNLLEIDTSYYNNYQVRNDKRVRNWEQLNNSVNSFFL